MQAVGARPSGDGIVRQADLIALVALQAAGVVTHSHGGVVGSLQGTLPAGAGAYCPMVGMLHVAGGVLGGGVGAVVRGSWGGSDMLLVTAPFAAAHDSVRQQGHLAVDALRDGLGFLMGQGQVLHHFLCNLGRCVLCQIELEANGLDLTCTSIANFSAQR